MKCEGVEFGEALRILAQRAGVTLGGTGDRREDERHQRLYQANEAAAACFHHLLLTSKAARGARDYLGERGLDAETIEAFQLGYSLDSWDALTHHLNERSFTNEELLAAGLLVESDRGGYDRFRGRLMFPIRDERGRVVGFGARMLASGEGGAEEQTGAKYINTPQSPVFDKSGLLFAMDRAKAAIRRERTAIVVEGYMDAIAAHQHGIANVVASMGTALTERQIRALERLRARVLLALDADAAGMEATLRALQEGGAAGAVRAGAESAHPGAMDEEAFAQKAQEWSRDALKRASVTFSVVPLLGKDPDEMIRADRSAWDAAVGAARPFTDHVFETAASRRDLAQPGERAELLQELLPVLRLIDEPVYRAHYIQRLARLAQVDEGVVRTQLRRPPARPGRRGAAIPEAAPERSLPREPAEEFCLALLLRHPELRAQGVDFSPELLLFGEHRAIFAAWRDSPDLDTLRDALPEEVHPHLDRILARDLPVLEGAPLQDALRDCVRRIEIRRLLAAKQASASQLADPEAREEMGAAVEEAHLLWEGGDRGAGPDDASHRQQLAAALVDDMERGHRLHEARRGAQQHDSPTPPREEATS